jgi:hypothetical protein
VLAVVLHGCSSLSSCSLLSWFLSSLFVSVVRGVCLGGRGHEMVKTTRVHFLSTTSPTPSYVGC